MTAVDQTPTEWPPASARALTLDDVAELAATDETHRYELDEGTLLMMAPADFEHGEIVMKLAIWLAAHGHDSSRLRVDPGLKIGQSSGRTPDLVLLREAVDGSTVWASPGAVALVVEVVSKGSRKVDRMVKPGEYARAGIAHFWRVEREDGPATVHMYALGSGEQGDPAYIAHQAVLLEELVSKPPPALL